MAASQVLIVEDELIFAKDIEQKLKKLGLHVMAILTSGEEAVIFAVEKKPDLVLMDIRLSGRVDGIQAADSIRKRAGIPVIYLTAMLDNDTVQRAKEIEPYEYILKPAENRELKITIEMAFYKHSIEKELRRQLQRTQAMRSIDEAIIKNRNLRQTLVDILEQVTVQLNVDAAAILLHGLYHQTLEYCAVHGIRSFAYQDMRVRIGEGLAGRAAETRQCIQVADLIQQKASSWMIAEGFVFYVAQPLVVKDQVKGVMEIFHRSPHPIESDWMDFLQILSNQTAIALDNASMYEDLIAANMELSQAYNATIEGWSAALEMRDLETEGHSQRVTEMTLKLARALGVPEDQMQHLRRGALLHDVGKMGIPDHILLRPGPLSKGEWKTMRKHPEYAYNLLSSIPFLKPALEIPYCHHEKWDGSGYPQGLAGDQIPLSARIFTVVDVWDALLSNRPYHQAWPEEKVLEHLLVQAGQHFDPTVVEKFLHLRREEIRMSNMSHNPVGKKLVEVPT